MEERRMPDKSGDEGLRELYWRYSSHSMVGEEEFLANLRLAGRVASNESLREGCIVECGTWRGGMAAALVHLFGPKWSFHFFDSFQGLPAVTSRDGPEALEWQQDPGGPRYFNNCTASREEFDEALALVPLSTDSVSVHEGWLDQTSFVDTGPISLLRLDVDWYESTLLCLQAFWPRLLRHAVVIMDDYHCWTGCRRALHEFLSSIDAAEDIRTTCPGGVAWLEKE